MTTLAQLRDELVTLLAAEDVPAVNHLPEVPDPPIALVTEGDPLLAPGETIGTHRTTWQVLLLVEGDNELMTRTLDDLTARAVLALTDGGSWRVEASAYVAVEKNARRFLGCRLTCTDSTISLTTHPDTEE